MNGDGGAGVAEQTAHVVEEGFGPPPTDNVGSRRGTGRCGVAEGYVVDGETVVDGGLDQGRLERLHGASCGDTAFSENDQAILLGESMGNLFVDADRILALLPVDEEHMEGAGQPSDDGPVLEVASGHKGTAQDRREQEDIEVTEMVGNQVIGRLGSGTLNGNGDTNNSGEASAPHPHNTASPFSVKGFRNQRHGPKGQTDGPDDTRPTEDKGKADTALQAFHD